MMQLRFLLSLFPCVAQTQISSPAFSPLPFCFLLACSLSPPFDEGPPFPGRPRFFFYYVYGRPAPASFSIHLPRQYVRPCQVFHRTYQGLTPIFRYVQSDPFIFISTPPRVFFLGSLSTSSYAVLCCNRAEDFSFRLYLSRPFFHSLGCPQPSQHSRYGLQQAVRPRFGKSLYLLYPPEPFSLPFPCFLPDSLPYMCHRSSSTPSGVT